MNPGPAKEAASRDVASAYADESRKGKFWSAPTRLYSLDVDYEYRQDSNLLYLTGIDQEGTILALLPGSRDPKRREILFVSQPNPIREHWTGHLLTREDATAQSGVETVVFVPQFERFVETLG